MPPEQLLPIDSRTTLPVNGLAAAYQPRRSFAAGVSIAWNLAFAALFVASGEARRLYVVLETVGRSWHVSGRPWAVGSYVAVYFAVYALLNYPVEFYFGYLEERQFGLAKDGVRAWTRDWLGGTLQHGFAFCIGSGLILTLQVASPHAWLAWVALALLALFLLTTTFAPTLLPRGLFEFEAVDASIQARLERLIAPHPAGALPPVVIFGATHLRDFTGGLCGLGPLQVMLVSRAAITTASDGLLRFVLLHDLGHRRYRHLLLSTLGGWAWVAIGLCVCHWTIACFAPSTIGLPPYVAWLALTLSLWMAAGEPLLAYLGRRLEYQADRYYLRHGGTLAEMTAALEELSNRNLARTDGLRRRNTMFHPLPSVWNRLYAARRYSERMRETR